MKQFNFNFISKNVKGPQDKKFIPGKKTNLNGTLKSKVKSIFKWK